MQPVLWVLRRGLHEAQRSFLDDSSLKLNQYFRTELLCVVQLWAFLAIARSWPHALQCDFEDSYFQHDLPLTVHGHMSGHYYHNIFIGRGYGFSPVCAGTVDQRNVPLFHPEYAQRERRLDRDGGEDSGKFALFFFAVSSGALRISHPSDDPGRRGILHFFDSDDHSCGKHILGLHWFLLPLREKSRL